VGGVAEALKGAGQDIKTHWHHHMDLLEREGRVAQVQCAPKGYSYFLRDQLGAVRVDNAFIVGDAVGLATRDLGEGIGAAVASGKLAAQAILTGADYSLEHLDFFSLPAMLSHRRRLATWLKRFLHRRFGVPEMNGAAL
jgi:flavin-dependent dehydrogenase